MSGPRLLMSGPSKTLRERVERPAGWLRESALGVQREVGFEIGWGAEGLARLEPARRATVEGSAARGVVGRAREHAIEVADGVGAAASLGVELAAGDAHGARELALVVAEPREQGQRLAPSILRHER